MQYRRTSTTTPIRSGLQIPLYDQWQCLCLPSYNVIGTAGTGQCVRAGVQAMNATYLTVIKDLENGFRYKQDLPAVAAHHKEEPICCLGRQWQVFTIYIHDRMGALIMYRLPGAELKGLSGFTLITLYDRSERFPILAAYGLRSAPLRSVNGNLILLTAQGLLQLHLP